MILKNYRLPLLLLAGMLIGLIVGSIAEPYSWGHDFLTSWVKPIGQIFLNLLFTVLVPLVFASVASAVARFESTGRLGPLFGYMMLVFTITGTIASLLMLTVLSWWHVGGNMLPLTTQTLPEPASMSDQIVNALTVNDFWELLSRKAMLPLIIFSALFGLAIQQLGHQAAYIRQWLFDLNAVMMKLVDLVMWIAPLGLMAWFAYLRGTYGSDLMLTLGRSVAVFFVVSAVYYGVFFSGYVWWAAGIQGLRRFWRCIVPPSLVAFGSGSSIAAIPLNLEAARLIGVPRSIRELVIPIGATIHMDGSCLSAISKIALLSTVYGFQLHTPGGWATALGIALLSSIVMSGIPGGGKVGELLIISLFGFPIEGLILINALGDLVDSPATAVNSVGDSVACMMVTRLDQGAHWLPAEQGAID
jgi:Na+/H+-dicarboxylate symporter